MIIALAGHVDHGKTTLVRALTGTDTDRLPEERRRGMTIELGFAYARQPDGVLLGFVDVPGHERFFGTALAGILNAAAGLLVVAADDGPMPQTIEHLEVLRLVGVPRLVAAVTKTDRVAPERVAEVTEAVRALLAQAGYRRAPILPVAPLGGGGIAELRAVLAALPAPALAGSGFRLQIDRAFVLSGIGLVVTGTVAAGRVRPGESLLLSPARLAARVRSIQIAGAAAEQAAAGERAALAIAGPRLERARIGRGDWLVVPALHAPTERIDVRLTAAHPLRHAGDVLVHLGAAETPGRVLLAGGADLAAGETGFARLLLRRPVGALHSDRLILRAVATGRLAAGGVVIDPFPPARREGPPARRARQEAQAEADPSAALASLLRAQGAVDLALFARARNLDPAQAAALAAGAGALVRGSAVLSAAARAALRARLLDGLARAHRDQPARLGPPRAALLARGGLGYPAPVAEAVLAELLDEGAVIAEGAALRLPGHRPILAAEDEAAWGRVRPLLEAAGLRPPRVRELAEALGLDPAVADALLTRLERFGLLVRVAPNRLFLPETVAALAAHAAALADAGPEGTFAAAAFNARTGIGRNLTIQVLEFLDRQGVTRRLGEVRCIVSGPVRASA
ncbi:MAG TPA: selenocysteine-specific translation elongation factor [Acetobacteraceae bacterium]|nr:selenocysteine-specific translation elongation factor [Acetobacteraceae bacterium]